MLNKGFKYDTVLYQNCVYQGLVSEGKRYGIGALLFDTGTFVLANFLSDQLHGNFQVITADGNELCGQFEEGSAEGIFILKRQKG